MSFRLINTVRCKRLLDSRSFGMLLLFCCTTLVGCGQTNAPTDPALARNSLSQALDLWKSGAAHSELQSKTQIVMSDIDWKAGRKLESYRIVEGDRDDGVNLHSTVELKLKGGSAKPRQVTYIVGTAPVVTIHRDQ